MHLIGHDERHDAPIYESASIEELELTEDERQRHRVVTVDGLPLDGLLLPGRDDRLVVLLHGAFEKEVAPPRFQYLRLTQHRSESLLYLADPTVELCPGLSLGWYVGTDGLLAADAVAAYVRRVADLVGAREVVVLGHSGGGFASAQIGHRVPNSVAVTLNAQTRVAGYLPWAVELFRKAAFPNHKSMEDVEAEHRSALDLLELYRTPAAEGHRLLAYQSPGDYHLLNHWLPWIDAMVESQPRGDAGRHVFKIGMWGVGHAGPPSVNPYIDEAFRMLT